MLRRHNVSAKVARAILRIELGSKSGRTGQELNTRIRKIDHRGNSFGIRMADREQFKTTAAIGQAFGRVHVIGPFYECWVSSRIGQRAVIGHGDLPCQITPLHITGDTHRSRDCAKRCRQIW